MPDEPRAPTGEGAALVEYLAHHRDSPLEWRDREVMEGVSFELVRLTAEVERLRAERADHGPEGRNVTNTQHQAMRERAEAAEARAARLEAALREIRDRIDLSASGLRPIAARALTEGADHAEE